MTPCLIEKTGLNFVPLTLLRSVLTDEVPPSTRFCKLYRRLVVLAELILTKSYVCFSKRFEVNAEHFISEILPVGIQLIYNEPGKTILI